MSRSTLADATAELYGLLWTGTAPTFSASGIDAASVRVYDHEPRELSHPIGVTVAFGGSDAGFWVLTVRIYSSTVKYSDKAAQDQLALLMPAVEAKVASNGGFDPSGWSPLNWDESLSAFVVANEVSIGRQDFGG